MTNPFLENRKTPAFDKIKPEHFKPAFDEAFATARQAYENLRTDAQTPDFRNTVTPFDSLFTELGDLLFILSNLVYNARSEEYKNLMEEIEKAYDAFSKEIFQDRQLATRFKTVYDQKDTLSLDSEDRWFLKTLFDSFQDSGAFLDTARQKRLQEIDTDLIGLAKKFMDNSDEAEKQNAFLVTDPALLAGIPADVVSGFETQARENGHQNGWLFIPERLLVDDLLEVAENREFRRKIHESLNNIGKIPPYDNRPVIQDMITLRHERATLLGYDSYADHNLSQTMAGSVQRVEELFEESVKYLLLQFEKDMDTLQAWVSAKGGPQLEPWDVPFYTAQYKEETFQFDAGKLSEYLELENVMAGWFEHATRDMNITFTQTTNYPTWHPDVRAYETFDHDTGERGVLFIDLFARPGQKIGGAWMNRVQGGNDQKNELRTIVYNMNLIKPRPGQPVLVSPEQVRTIYHEGGHALNGLKGTAPKYKSQHGTGNGSDFVEIHSTMQEIVPFLPEVLQTYAFHYDTGDMVPNTLVKAMTDSENFMASRELLKVIQNSLRDLKIHTIDPANYTTDQDIEDVADLDSPYSDHIRAYPLTRFGHLFSDGNSQYAAGYYGYFWSDVAQATAFEPFENGNLYNETLLKKKRAFYAAGAGLESNEAFEAFTGVPAGNPRALLKKAGIEVGSVSKQPPVQKPRGPQP